jgi:hypothetical protein
VNNVDMSKVLAFVIPALSAAFKDLPASTSPWVNLIEKAVLVELEQAAKQLAPAALQAHAPMPHQFGLPASVVKPPESEWHEAGIKAWAKAQVQSMS